MMRSASNRFDLSLSLTAGWDSRLVLAACKEISNKISYMTVRQIRMADNSADIKIPARLLSKLGFEHHIVRATHRVNSEFVKIYKKNLPLAHDIWLPDAHTILEYYNQGKVAIVGSGSKVGRLFYRIPKYLSKKITAKDLSFITGMRNNHLEISYYDKWLAGLGDIHNFNILDLFYWEQRAGNWLAMGQLKFGMVWKEIFTPFNCRNLLISMLSVNEKYRKPFKYRLYKYLILELWPEILSEPINPHQKRNLKSLI